MKGKGEMTTYFLLNKKNHGRPTRYLQPSNQSSQNPQNGNDSNMKNSKFNGSNGNNHYNLSSSSGLFLNPNNANIGNKSSQPMLNRMLVSPASRLTNLWSHGDIIREPPRLPVIREDSHQGAFNEDRLFLECNTHKVPSYNEPKPIIMPKLESKQSHDISKEIPLVPISELNQPSVAAYAETQLMMPAYSTTIMSNVLQETDLDSFSQHNYGAIKKPDSKQDFFFDGNSSTNIKCQLLEQKKTFSPTLSNRTTFSIADTTKATIQSEESLENLLDDSQFESNTRHQENDSPIYNISSNSSDQSSQYGHIIKKSYAKECLENGFYKNNANRQNGSGNRKRTNNKLLYKDSKDDYCVFIRRDHGVKVTQDNNSRDSSLAMAKRPNKQHNQKNSKAYYSKGQPPLQVAALHEPSPSSFSARHHRHYQAHNSPLIVHRFYHIDNVSSEDNHSKRSFVNNSSFNSASPSTSLVANRKCRGPVQGPKRYNDLDDEADAKFPLLYPIGVKPDRQVPVCSDSDSDDMNSVAAAVMGEKYSGNSRIAQRLLERSSSFNSSSRRKGSLPDYYKSRSNNVHYSQPQYGKIKKKLSSLESMVMDGGHGRNSQQATTDSPQSIFSIDSFQKGKKLYQTGTNHDEPNISSLNARRLNTNPLCYVDSKPGRKCDRFESNFEPRFGHVTLLDDNANLKQDFSSELLHFNDNHRDVLQQKRRPVYESDDSYYADEDENEDQHNNLKVEDSDEVDEDDDLNDGNGQHRELPNKYVSMHSARSETMIMPMNNAPDTKGGTIDDVVSFSNDNGLTDAECAMSELNSMFNECPDNRMLDFDNDFGQQSAPMSSESCSSNEDDNEQSMSSKTSSIHEMTDGASEFLYDSDGQSIHRQQLLEEFQLNGNFMDNNNGNRLLVTDLDSLDHHLSMMLNGTIGDVADDDDDDDDDENDNGDNDGYHKQTASNKQQSNSTSIISYDTNMNHSIDSMSRYERCSTRTNSERSHQANCDNIINNNNSSNELEV